MKDKNHLLYIEIALGAVALVAAGITILKKHKDDNKKRMMRILIS